MPEGHILHRLARDQSVLNGRVVDVTSPQGRFRVESESISGRRLESVGAYGKHLFHTFEGDAVVHVHLGMQGKFFPVKDVTAAARSQVRMRIGTEDVKWDLIAPGKCELLTSAQVAVMQAGFGPDPLRPDGSEASAWSNVSAFDGPIGAALLDQSVIAGPGNVFRSEALAAIGVHPLLPCRQLDEATFAKLWTTLQLMMKQAVEDNRIITVDVPSGERADFPEEASRYVYKQSVCRRTGTPVETLEIGGRTAYVCPVCQPVP